jgi:hypothetical protein
MSYIKCTFFCLFFFHLPFLSISQGCIAIRGNSSCHNSINNSFTLKKGEFDVQFGYRYFKSFRHFRGDVEEVHRVEEGTQVINKSNFIDLTLSYGISDRFFTNIIIPTAFHNRSSMYEHGGNPPQGLGDRHVTSSKGMSDIRLSLSYWLFNPDKKEFNYAVGFGIKLPAGKYDYTDYFYNQGVNKNETIKTVVDQSIQLGDGGTGITMDVQGFHPISSRISIITNLYYLFNFQESNGVKTRNGNSEFSCPDQYAARLGANIEVSKGINFFMGARLEGVPSTDLLGKSGGYRRPGYAFSIEPGISYLKKNYSLFATVPIATYRNRTQSFEDKQRTLETGVYRHGDAAFADYLINIGFSYRFTKH